MRETMIISAFPGCGKTTCTNTTKEFTIMDSDSSDFSWIKDENGNNTTERNPEFPQNYIRHIFENLGKFEVIFISSHKEVRDALLDLGVQFFLIYPNINLKDEWIYRFRNRGSSESFISKISENWDSYINEIESLNGVESPIRIELTSDFFKSKNPFAINKALVINDELLFQIQDYYTEIEESDEIIDFIELIKGEPVDKDLLETPLFDENDSAYNITTEIFTNGDCGRFGLILQYIFPMAELYYLPATSHVYTKFDNYFYDITGRFDSNYLIALQFLLGSELEKVNEYDIKEDHLIYSNYSFNKRGPII